MLNGRFGAQGKGGKTERQTDRIYHAKQSRQQTCPLFVLVMAEKPLDFNGFVLVGMIENW